MEMTESDLIATIRTQLSYIGEDPQREGLRETPERVLRAWQQLYGGYRLDPAAILGRTFAGDGFDQMVLLTDIPFWSTCEHHLLPFHGTATVGYLPGDMGRVVGISKIARVVDVYARRLQIQERMTRQIAEAILEHLDPSGVGVIVRAQHCCMQARGVEKSSATMVTSVMLGRFREDARVREEFLSLSGTRPGGGA